MTQPNVDFRSELAGQAEALRSLARQLVRSDDAEDIAQQAMVNALSQSTRPRSLRPWLRQVLRNEHRAFTRRTIRRRTREQVMDTVDATEGVEDATARAEMVGALHEALATLDAPYRRVLEAKFFEDRTAADIARSEGCPAGTIRWRVQEGLRRMRRTLDERYEDRATWTCGMAAVFALPLPSSGSSPGEPSMIKTTMLKWTGAGLLTAGALAVAFTSVGEADGSEPSVAKAASADGAPTAQARPASRPGGPTARTTQAPAEAAMPPAPTPSDAEPGCDGTCPEPSCDGECPPEPGCGGGCAPEFSGLPSFGSCLDDYPLGPYDRVQLSLQTAMPDDDGHAVIESVEVTSQGEPDDSLKPCLEGLLMGATLTVPPGHAETMHIGVVLTGDGAPAEDYQQRSDAPEDLPTPTEYVRSHDVPTRTEGQAPTELVVECAEFDCPFCNKARATLDQVVDEHPEASVAWLHNPLAVHPGAMVAARASVAAHAQGAFWAMHERLFDSPERRSEADMIAIATELKLDVARFEADMKSAETQARIERESQICRASGGNGTPSFFVDEHLVVGAQPYESFAEYLQ
ncbi:MAG: sigma-70 family RNA polymerase sigma factor [Myxococcota bacterium]